MKRLFVVLVAIVASILLVSCAPLVIQTSTATNVAAPSHSPSASPIKTARPVETSNIKPPTTPSPLPTPTRDPRSRQYFEGMYEVGVDIPEGEYYIECMGDSCYFQVASDASGEFDSIVTNDNFSTFSILTVKKGQYLTVDRGNFALYDFANKSNYGTGVWPEGMYKVGDLLPAGKYTLTPTGDSAYFETCRDSRHTLHSIIANDNFSGQKIISVKKGQYLDVSRATIEARK